MARRFNPDDKPESARVAQALNWGVRSPPLRMGAYTLEFYWPGRGSSELQMLWSPRVPKDGELQALAKRYRKFRSLFMEQYAALAGAGMVFLLDGEEVVLAHGEQPRSFHEEDV